MAKVKRLKVTIRMEMEEDEQAKRKEAHDSLSIPDFAKDAYLYRIGLDHHINLLKQHKKSTEEDK